MMRIVTAFSLVLLFAELACGQQYFPKGALVPGNERQDTFIHDWYSTQLAGLQEPPIWELPRDHAAHVYRFLWLRTFHHPVAVRITIQPDGSATVIAKVADGSGGYDPGKLIVDQSATLAQDAVRRLFDEFDRSGYWTLPQKGSERGGNDGARWIIETVKDGRYRLVDQWSPSSGPVRRLGLYLLEKVAGMQLKRNEIY